MLLGIVTDIHDEVENLRRALEAFERAGVDQVISLGDAFDTFEPGEAGPEVCRMLSDAGAVGVWGNHDVGASLFPSSHLLQRADPEVLAFARTLEPFLVRSGVRFSHIEPWLDATRLIDLWTFDGPPSTAEKAQRSFDAVPERMLFLGHFHRWLLMTPRGQIPLDPTAPVPLPDSGRVLVVVAAVLNGWCALFDTETHVLVPVRCAA